MKRKNTHKNNAEVIIELRNLSKVFHIPHEERKTLAESIIGTISKGKVRYEKLYALKNINLQLRKGEFLGVIGSNGSGKTTLLKIIAGILEPNKGRAEVKGKVVPFLELGIGFVGELTAKENIYLYSALLGMSKNETKQRFQNIVEFADLEKFIDAPIKDFSTGMLARLAFSIAKEVNGDIYLIDEVLAVGDEAFQKKCLRVFEKLKAQRKTVVFVSHNTGLINSICEKTVLLDEGRIKKIGSSLEVTSYYEEQNQLRDEKTQEINHLMKKLEEEKKKAEKANSIMQVQNQNIAKERQIIEVKIKELEQEKQALIEEKNKPKFTTGRMGTREAEILKVEFYNGRGIQTNTFITGDRFKATLHYNAKQRIIKPVFGIGFYDSKGKYITGPNTLFSNFKISFIKGKGKITYAIASLPLLPGKYLFSAALHDESNKKCYDWHDKLYKITVMPGSSKEKFGIIQLPCKWEHQENE